MTDFDLGAARRKRDGRAPKWLVITGDDGREEFRAEVAPELPAVTLDHGAAGRMAQAVESVFLNQADADAFTDRYRPSLNDLADMLTGLYGLGELGEALASGASSTSDGTR